MRKMSYQMDTLITKLIEIIKKQSGERNEAKYMSKKNAIRYVEFLRGLKYEHEDGEGASFCGETIYESVKKLIRDNINTMKFTFVLGAGVSNDFNIPNWEELVFRINYSKYWQNMYGETKENKEFYPFKGDYNKSVYYKLKSGLFRLNSNLYEWAQYSENNFKQDEEDKERRLCMEIPSKVTEMKLDNVYYSVVKQALYYNADKKTDKEFSQSTLGCICQITKKKKLERIITYNYDDCFEYCWEEVNCGSPAFDCLPIFDKEQLYIHSTYEGKRCEIYHVHGFIPKLSSFEEGKNKYRYIETAAKSYDGKKLILSEVSYDDIQDEIYKWRNDVQVDTLLRYSCIFVGFSATDINFKRIVKQISKVQNQRAIEESPKHYIVVCLDDYIKSFYCGKTQIKKVKDFLTRLNDEQKCNELYPYIISALEMLIDRNNYLIRYGIYPLFTTIEDLPKLLYEITVSL